MAVTAKAETTNSWSMGPKATDVLCMAAGQLKHVSLEGEDAKRAGVYRAHMLAHDRKIHEVFFPAHLRLKAGPSKEPKHEACSQVLTNPDL